MPIRITGMNSGLDTESIIRDLVSAYDTKKDKYVKAQTKLSWKQDAWKDMNAKIYNFYSKSLSNMRFSGNFANKKKTTVSDESKATVTANGSVVNGTQTLEVKQLASAGYLTGAKLTGENPYKNTSKLSELGIKDGTLKFTIGAGDKAEVKSIDVKADMSIADLNSALKEQGLSANFDANQQRFFITSGNTGVDNDFNFSTDAGTTEILKKLGLDSENAIKQKASNAIIELNGARFEGSTNKFSINGLEITAHGVSDKMNITTSTDTDGIYNMIKDFLKEYNTLTNAMEKAFNAKSAKGFEPLTNDEKDAMSDTEVEEWETKIKDALLRRDGTLNSVLSGLSMSASKTYMINGKSYSLGSFGIGTAGFLTKTENESYALHINGDKDDSVSSDKTDKLREMIESDPEAVTEFFTNFAKDMYNDLDSKMKSTTLSSSYTVYNDKQLEKEYNSYTDTIKKWEDKVASIEDKYYKQFAAMEKALGELQSQTSSLTSMLGM